MPTCKDDQYFTLDRSDYSDALDEIKRLLEEDTSNNEPYEKVWIPENQVTGKIKKMSRSCFEKTEAIFNERILPSIEEKTQLQNLELVAVRSNTLNQDDMVSLHSDSLGYVLMVDVVRSVDFEGGNVLFRKDDGEIEELDVSPDQLLVAKCTNEHGVTRVKKGQRESLAFFARPKE